MRIKKKKKKIPTLKLSKFTGCISDVFQVIFNSILIWVTFNAANGSKTIEVVNNPHKLSNK